MITHSKLEGEEWVEVDSGARLRLGGPSSTPSESQHTPREARNALIDGFITALRVRPTDFKPNDHDGGSVLFTIDDAVTGQRWWVANGRFGFHLFESSAPGSCPEVRFGWWARRRAWKAFLQWRAANYTQTRHARLASEAVKLHAANSHAGA